MTTNRRVKELAMDWSRAHRAGHHNIATLLQADMEALLISELLLKDESANVSFISHSDCAPIIGVALTTNHGFIINYATGEITEY